MPYRCQLIRGVMRHPDQAAKHDLWRDACLVKGRWTARRGDMPHEKMQVFKCLDGPMEMNTTTKCLEHYSGELDQSMSVARYLMEVRGNSRWCAHGASMDVTIDQSLHQLSPWVKPAMDRPAYDDGVRPVTVWLTLNFGGNKTHEHTDTRADGNFARTLHGCKIWMCRPPDNSEASSRLYIRHALTARDDPKQMVYLRRKGAVHGPVRAARPDRDVLYIPPNWLHSVVNTERCTVGIAKSQRVEVAST